jgi:elongation factor P hydroxylase
LIAGDERRTQVDYGYWYAPDGRNAQQQKLFQQVEVKPQALEWILSDAAHYPFQFSFDNLTGDDASEDMEAFKSAVYQQKERYCQQGLWSRAERFRLALMHFYAF